MKIIICFIIPLLICSLIITVLSLIKYSINRCLFKLKHKCLYSKDNLQLLRYISKTEYKIDLYFPSASLPLFLILYIVTTSILLTVKFKTYIINVITSININSIKEQLSYTNEQIEQYIYILSIVVTAIVFIIVFAKHFTFKNNFTKTINEFKTNKLNTVLEFHSKIVYPIANIIIKNRKNSEYLLMYFQKVDGVKINYLAKALTEHIFPKAELCLYTSQPTVKEKKMCKSTHSPQDLPENISNDIRNLYEIIVEFNRTHPYYSLNVFTSLDKKISLPYYFLFITNNDIDNYISNLSHRFLTKEYLDEQIKTIENPNAYFDEYKQEKIINIYNAIKSNLEELIIRSIDSTVMLEEYDTSLAKVLSPKRKDFKNAIYRAIKDR